MQFATAVVWALALLCGTGECDWEHVRAVRRVQVPPGVWELGTDIAQLCTGTVALARKGASARLPGCRPPPQSATRSRLLAAGTWATWMLWCWTAARATRLSRCRWCRCGSVGAQLAVAAADQWIVFLFMRLDRVRTAARATRPSRCRWCRCAAAVLTDTSSCHWLLARVECAGGSAQRCWAVIGVGQALGMGMAHAGPHCRTQRAALPGLEQLLYCSALTIVEQLPLTAAHQAGAPGSGCDLRQRGGHLAGGWLLHFLTAAAAFAKLWSTGPLQMHARPCWHAAEACCAPPGR